MACRAGMGVAGTPPGHWVSELRGHGSPSCPSLLPQGLREGSQSSPMEAEALGPAASLYPFWKNPPFPNLQGLTTGRQKINTESGEAWRRKCSLPPTSCHTGTASGDSGKSDKRQKNLEECLPRHRDIDDWTVLLCTAELQGAGRNARVLSTLFPSNPLVPLCTGLLMLPAFG